MDRYLTTADLAERYHTAESTIRYWRHAGSGPRGTLIGRRVLYRQTEVERWEREQEEAEICRAATR